MQVITVEDTTAPEFLTVPADITIECSAEDLEAVLSENATAGDLCGPVVVEYVNEYSLTDALGNYTVTRTFTATDDAGNFSTAVQIVTVEDTTAPEFTYVPGDLTIECSAEELEAVLSENAAAGDLCGPVVVEYVNDYSLTDALGNYTVTRTFTATDDAGNFSTAVQVVTVEDTTAPVLTIPADYTVECSDEIVLDEASATDNCGEIVIDLVEVINPGNATGNYTIVRTFTATDDAGNATTDSDHHGSGHHVTRLLDCSCRPHHRVFCGRVGGCVERERHCRRPVRSCGCGVRERIQLDRRVGQLHRDPYVHGDRRRWQLQHCGSDHDCGGHHGT